MMFVMRKFMLLLLVIVMGGCAIVTVPLFPSTEPLEEVVVGGRGRDKVLLLDVSGIISTAESSSIGGIKEEPSLVAQIKEQLELASRDEHVRAVVVKINTPGGTVTASDILHHELLRFKQMYNVKLIACLMDLATSGGYYVATAADKIIAHPTTITGSVGVIVLKLNLDGLMEKLGIEDESLKTGDKKDILSPARPITPEERKLVKDLLAAHQQRFLQVIREGRPNLDEQTIARINDGRILSAKEAGDLGLVDYVGYLDQAIALAKQEAGLPEAKVIVYRPPHSYRENIYTQGTTTVSNSQIKISLLPFDLPKFKSAGNPQFMYLWLP